MSPLSAFISSQNPKPSSTMSKKLKKVGDKIRSSTFSLPTSSPIAMSASLTFSFLPELKPSPAPKKAAVPRRTSFPNLNATSYLDLEATPPSSPKLASTRSSSKEPLNLHHRKSLHYLFSYSPKPSTDNSGSTTAARSALDAQRRQFRRDPSMQALWADMHRQGLATPWDPAWKRALDKVIIPVEDAAERVWSVLEEAGEEAFVFTAVGLGVWSLGNVPRAGAACAVGSEEDEEEYGEAEVKKEKGKEKKISGPMNPVHISGFTSSTPQAQHEPTLQPARKIRHKRSSSDPSPHHRTSITPTRPTTPRSQSHQPTRTNSTTTRHLLNLANTLGQQPSPRRSSTPAPSLNYIRLKHSRQSSVTSAATMGSMLSAATTNETTLWDELRLVVTTNSVEDILGGRKVPGMRGSREVFPGWFDERGMVGGVGWEF
ncbi:hypothetical protein BJ508DRAFT_323003 [Ascobolus immersus RN42]|uniref:Uncharacterized protein n=1 Tax=Ascobolus immersus RN42 TaxID=1160509 RepID=A0A3N4IHS1_ASCIM|nr:hypothetical protein BJ508DRAFT_323003 [Ascobolus immersus RN42]